ncbi:MAG TPA: epoxyqueuosine reductase QueH [Myxococcota bacterium]|nr:epoxyqueuosine reductase QueH [Myxococcota bacterium]HRY93165.1 epoxyqueuosine reductase QueH [Myxococcota bacterium]HSA23121.1 epoxyqueuosine reductase QueH [Myxococcota bacterium]
MSPAARQTLLVHACCAPCAAVPLHRLRERWDLQVLFYGPNIQPTAEHDRRLGELERLCGRLGVPLRVEPGPAEEWEAAVAAHRQAPEHLLSPRCRECFALRLGRTARVARALGAAAFTTSLSVGRLKSAPVLFEVGRAAGLAAGVEFLAEDFKKADGQGLSLALSRLHGLTRQGYCGCAPSLAEVTARRARRAAAQGGGAG